MSILLTEQEVLDIRHGVDHDGTYQGFARAIQLALIEKMRKEPVGYLDSHGELRRLNTSARDIMPIYLLPTPQELEEQK